MTTPAKKTTATTTKSTTKTATKTATKKTATTTAAPAGPVTVGGIEWTQEELREIRAELETERDKARHDLQIAEADLQGLLREAGDGAGDDQADAGASIGGRDYEMTLAAGQRDKLDQVEHALERLDDGTYGTCESCGKPIGKLRLQAAPRATLCVDCKTRQESR
ncbi:TraR/DksA family transcriptional regulator [Lapillicoccus jejuensis]|uniref:TraR/DksA family transcriptional regulator n=1 Tax=Lapillicoccus jejuensis TaxID=402171 RepID=UPI001FE58D6C|nr:TraR/DksA family transcriptional regulator [Lapillicoccus jejuensis]